MLRHAFLCMFLLLFAASFSRNSDAAQTHVAVAANFTAPAKKIAQAFFEDTGHKAILSFGSTGKLFAQIVNGAPFELFLAADQARPIKAEKDGLAVEGTRFTYATGKIILYSPDPDFIDTEGQVLGQVERFNKLAIANPKTAPYGIAATQVLKKMGLLQTVREKLVRGENIAQTYQFVATRNAQLGFVSLSQVYNQTEGSRWLVPASFYTALHQDVVLLQKGKGKEAALAFHHFLKGAKARHIIAKFGYGISPH